MTVHAHLAVLREEPHISASAIGCYLRCPQQYFYRYLERLPAAHRAAAMVFGHALHEVLAAFYGAIQRGDGPLSAKHLQQLFTDTWGKELDEPVPVLFDQRVPEPALYEHGLALVEAFAKGADTSINVVGVEESFSVLLEHPTTQEPLSTRLVGVFDLVLQHTDQRYEVVEHKTAARAWSKNRLAHDLQLTLYSLAAPAVGLGDATITLQLLLKTKTPAIEQRSLSRSDRDRLEAFETIAGVLSAIDAGAFYRCRDWHCRTCPYLMTCLS